MSKDDIRDMFANGKPKGAVKKYRKEVIPHIMKFLTDKDQTVQKSAIIAFGVAGKRIGVSRKDVQSFIKSIDKFPPDLTPEIASAVADTGDVAILELISTLKSKLKPGQKEYIIELLQEIGQEKVSAGLLGEKITNPAQAALHELLLRTQTPMLENSNLSTYDPNIDYTEQLNDFKKMLSTMLSSKDESDLFRALDACGHFPTISAEFTKQISSVIGKSDEISIKALQTLGDLKNPDAIGKVSNQLSSPSSEIRIAATNSLGSIGHEKCVEPILKILNTEDEFLRQAAVNALGKIGEPAANELVNLLQREEYKEQVEIALKRIGEPAVKHLRRAMSHKNKAIRKNATDLAKMILTTKYGIGGTVLKLIELLGDKDAAVQEQVVETIIDMGDPGLDNVIRALASKNKNIRENSMEILDSYALMNIQLVTESVMKTNIISGAELFFLLGIFSTDEETTDFAFEKLTELDEGEEFNIAVKQAIIDNIFVFNDLFEIRDENIRFNIAQISGFLGSPIINHLIEFLSDKSDDVIEGALNSLGYLGDVAYTTVNHITKFVHDKNVELRKAAVRCLGAIKDPNGVAAILDAMKDNDEEVRSLATEAIDAIGVSSIPSLINLLDTNNSDSQDNLVEYLAKLDYNALKVSVLDSLNNESNYFQEGIIRLNKKLGELHSDYPDFLLTEARLIPNDTARQAAIRSFGLLKFEPAMSFLVDEILKKDKKYDQAVIDAVYLGYGENFVTKCLKEIEIAGGETEKSIFNFLKSVDANYTVIPLIEHLGNNPVKKELVIELIKKAGEKSIIHKLNSAENLSNLKSILLKEPDLARIVEKLTV